MKDLTDKLASFRFAKLGLQRLKNINAQLKMIGVHTRSLGKPRFIFENLHQIFKLTSRDTILSILLASFVVNLLSLALPIALLQTYDRVIPNQSIHTLIVLLLGVFSALIMESILKISRSYVASWMDAKYEHRLTCKAFSHLIRSQLRAFEKKGIGAHLDDLNSLNYVRSFYASQALSMIMDAPFILIFLGLIAYIGGWLVFLPLLLLLSLFTYSSLINKNIEILQMAQQEHGDHELNFLINTLSNIHTVKAFGLETQMLRRYEELDAGRSVLGSYSNTEDTAIGLERQVGSQTALIFIATLGSLLVLNGSLTIGGLAACTILTGRCIQPLNSILSAWTRMQAIRVVRTKITNILKLPLETNLEKPAIGTILGKIELKNITLKTAEQKSLLFENLSLTIQPGETAGIQAEGQKGKSTLAQLIMGYIQPDSGTVLIDGKNIFDYNLNTFRTQIAYIPKDADLLSGTIMENMTLFDDKNRNTALRLSRVLGLTHLVKEMPRGFDTQVGNNAVEVIGQGVKQRIIIIRALLKAPKILIFDEGNSALDSAGDENLVTLLWRIKGHVTMLLLSERSPLI